MHTCRCPFEELGSINGKKGLQPEGNVGSAVLFFKFMIEISSEYLKLKELVQRQV